jgi:hypothetical protein
VSSVLYRLERGLCRKIEDRGDTGGHGGAQMSDMVDLKGVERYVGEIDLDLVGRNDPTNEIAPRPAALLGHGQDRRNVVARMATVETEKIVVIVELSNGCAVCPRRPFAMNVWPDGKPMMRAPPTRGCARACARALAMASLLSAAAAAAALSIRRSMTIATTCGSTATGSARLPRSARQAAPSVRVSRRVPGRAPRAVAFLSLPDAGYDHVMLVVRASIEPKKHPSLLFVGGSREVARALHKFCRRP